MPPRFWRNPFVAESSDKQIRRRRAFRTAIEAEYYESRREAMKTLYRGGATLEEVGALYGVTRERARQVIAGDAKRGRGVDPIKAINVCRRVGSLSAAATEMGVPTDALKHTLIALGYWKALKRLWGWRSAKAHGRLGDAELITALRRLAAKLGHTPAMYEANADPDTPSPTTYVHRWGNWAPACVAAGLTPSARGARGHKNRDPQTGFKAKCKRGHPLIEGNLYVWQGRRTCKACAQLRDEEKRQKLIDAGLLKPRRQRRSEAGASHQMQMAKTA